MKLFITIAFMCTAIVLTAAVISGLSSETVMAQNIETLSLKDMQVMFGGGDMEACETAYTGACTPRPGLSCNEQWSRSECVWSGIPSNYCEEFNSDACLDSDCYPMIVEDCRTY